MLTALLGAWEEVKAAEEARAEMEGQLFKTKTQSTTILTEEARFPLWVPPDAAALASYSEQLDWVRSHCN